MGRELLYDSAKESLLFLGPLVFDFVLRVHDAI